MSGGIGIVGCGAIGTEIAGAAARGELPVGIEGLWDINPEAAEKLAGSISPRPPIIEPREMIGKCALIVECAATSAVAPLADLCLEHETDLMVMSIGGLTEEIFLKFKSAKSRLYIPSGAVCGLDGIQAYAGHNIRSITLTTRKPPAGLKGAKYFDDNNINLDGLKEPTVVFEGSPSVAIKHFPKNINVSTAISLASSVNGQLKVRLIADPGITSNIHEIQMECDLGRITISVENKPSPANPKTSALAYLSAIATIRKIFSNVKIGT